MSLRERMQRTDSEARYRALYRRYGVIGNPFPSAGQPSGHPRMEDAVDDAMENRFRQFEEGGHASQVITIVGTQGVGKTNLLNHYEEQFLDYYREMEPYYIIRYYPDPEPSFDSVLRAIIRSFDYRHFENIGRALAQSGDEDRDAAKERAGHHDVRIVLNSLEHASGNDEQLAECARLALDWLLGMRVLKRHREVLGVSFRLDTVESRTQALRDVIYVSERLGLLEGIFLLLDELEKQDYSLSKTPVLRFLFSIRALIDALPKRLFLMLAMTVEARRRYFAMLPALAGRLQDTIALPPIKEPAEAERLFEFYFRRGREAAGSNPRVRGETQGASMLFDADELQDLFRKLRERSEERGIGGVTPRDYLHALHEAWESRAPGPEMSAGPDSVDG